MIKLLWKILWGEPKPGCTHEWETITQTVCPPSDALPDPDDYFFEDQERIFRGITSVLRSCRKCGEQKVYELLGQPLQ